MKSALSISLAVLILLQSFNMVWIVFSFKANQEYIAKNLCVNRSKPKMKCNGKCHLVKKIKESKEEKPNQAPTPKIDEQRQLDYINDITFFEIAETYSGAAQRVFVSQFFTAQSCVFKIFQPPKYSLIFSFA